MYVSWVSTVILTINTMQISVKDTQTIVGQHLSQQANDKQENEPALAALARISHQSMR